ncbi:MAG: hypothetical protein JWR07_5123 [Nevskia sp.]|nr:hypothetical protein [Nevskia sp.]
MGEAKRRKAEIERQKNEELAWRASLSPEQKISADVAMRAHDRIVRALNLREACYQMALFLNQCLRELHQVETEAVIGWINDGTWEGVASHAWIELGGKKIDISLTHTSHRDPQPSGGLLILDRLVTKGAANYSYYKEQPQSAIEYLNKLKVASPKAMEIMAQKNKQHQMFEGIARDPERIHLYLNSAPSPTRYDALLRLMS